MVRFGGFIRLRCAVASPPICELDPETLAMDAIVFARFFLAQKKMPSEGTASGKFYRLEEVRRRRRLLPDRNGNSRM